MNSGRMNNEYDPMLLLPPGPRPRSCGVWIWVNWLPDCGQQAWGGRIQINININKCVNPRPEQSGGGSSNSQFN